MFSHSPSLVCLWAHSAFASPHFRVQAGPSPGWPSSAQLLGLQSPALPSAPGRLCWFLQAPSGSFVLFLPRLAVSLVCVSPWVRAG